MQRGDSEVNLQKLAELIRLSSVETDTDTESVEFYFLPAYRRVNQIAETNVSLEKIVRTQDNGNIITEAISKIGKILGADLILTDLRAGITELSAPFLFDSRVLKYYVTSTSMQSVCGIHVMK